LVSTTNPYAALKQSHPLSATPSGAEPSLMRDPVVRCVLLSANIHDASDVEDSALMRSMSTTLAFRDAFIAADVAGFSNIRLPALNYGEST
jgi:hypothetical protein